TRKSPVLIASEPASNLCFDAFSSREPATTSLENAMSRFADLFDLHFLGYKSDKMHHRCAEMLDQGGGTIDWDDFRFLLAIARGGTVSAAAKQLGVDHATVIRRVDRLERHLSAKLFDR